ncbi:hypothetical protein [Fluviicola taffensis]|uniref:Polymorphic membrane protein n=1 Tax=Fluviicola taffensis (strain DSM 16823 / NCIMB 13979 / RW262) TaxID=755732 RepID=F2I9L6_FLUTR|nr:hypothetical protein [Fluviicola taffensis]AEA45197.1 polymorphic membrane protein [Fluviicola taffensis DSM 16823]
MKHSSFIKLFLIFCLIISCANSFAARIYVKQNAIGANNGTSWTNAYTSLEWALAFAASGDEIWVASGTYYTSDMNDPNNSFVLGDNVKLYGNFAGTETNINQRVDLTPATSGANRTNETILSGDIGVVGNNSDNAYRVMYLVGNTTSVFIDGIKIVGG